MTSRSPSQPKLWSDSCVHVWMCSPWNEKEGDGVGGGGACNLWSKDQISICHVLPETLTLSHGHALSGMWVRIPAFTLCNRHLCDHLGDGDRAVRPAMQQAICKDPYQCCIVITLASASLNPVLPAWLNHKIRGRYEKQGMMLIPICHSTVTHVSYYRRLLYNRVVLYNRILYFDTCFRNCEWQCLISQCSPSALED